MRMTARECVAGDVCWRCWQSRRLSANLRMRFPTRVTTLACKLFTLASTALPSASCGARRHAVYERRNRGGSTRFATTRRLARFCTTKVAMRMR